MEKNIWKKKIWIIKGKIIVNDQTDLKLWRIKFCLGILIWTNHTKRLFIIISDRNEERMYLEGEYNRNNMEHIFLTDNESNENSAWI